MNGWFAPLKALRFLSGGKLKKNFFFKKFFWNFEKISIFFYPPPRKKLKFFQNFPPKMPSEFSRKFEGPFFQFLKKIWPSFGKNPTPILGQNSGSALGWQSIIPLTRSEARIFFGESRKFHFRPPSKKIFSIFSKNRKNFRKNCFDFSKNSKN